MNAVLCDVVTILCLNIITGIVDVKCVLHDGTTLRVSPTSL